MCAHLAPIAASIQCKNPAIAGHIHVLPLYCRRLARAKTSEDSSFILLFLIAVDSLVADHAIEWACIVKTEYVTGRSCEFDSPRYYG